MNAIAPVQFEIHAKVKINDANVEQIANQHLVPIAVHEFIRAGAHYPVAFVKNSETGQFQPVCIFSITPGKNNFVKNGEWQGAYLPLIAQNVPLCLIATEENSDQFLIGINEASTRVNLEQGQALFNDAGQETDYFQARKQALVNFHEMTESSIAITQYLVNLGLLKEELIHITLDQKSVDLKNNESKNKLSLGGIYLINEEKLNTLSDQQFIELRTRGLLPIIYAQLGSFHHLARIAAFAG